MENSTGEIYQKKSTFEWEIADFLSLSDKNGCSYTSPRYDFADAVWFVKLYPNGGCKDDLGWISIFLSKLHPEELTHILDIKVSMEYERKIMKTQEAENSNFFKSNWGWSKFIQRSKVLDEINSLQKVLTIRIDVDLKSDEIAELRGTKIPEIASHPLEPKASWEKIIDSLKELFLSHSNSDITIKVKDKEFPAHKAILGARSTVLAAAFAHEMLENLNQTMKIDDFEPETVKDFLMFIYYGDVENLSPSNVFDLYAISHKYNVKDLTDECLAFMKKNIRLETICDALLFAEVYDESELFESAKRFAAKHVTELLSADQWEKLKAENLLLAHKLLEKIVLDNSWRIK